MVADPSTVVNMTGSTPTVICQGNTCMHSKSSFGSMICKTLLSNKKQRFQLSQTRNPCPSMSNTNKCLNLYWPQTYVQGGVFMHSLVEN